MQSSGVESADCAIGYGSLHHNSQQPVAMQSSDKNGTVLSDSISEAEVLEMTPVVSVQGGAPSPATSSTQYSRQKGKDGCCDKLKANMIRYGPGCCSHPELQKHSKLILVAIFFCIFGSALCATGLLIIIPAPHPTFSLVFIVGGAIILIPGIYHVVYVVLAYHELDGFIFDNLPNMD